MGKTIGEHFSRLEDPHQKRGRRHLLVDLMVFALCAVICDAGNSKAVSTFGRAKRKWFKSFLDLPHGLVSFFFENILLHMA